MLLRHPAFLITADAGTHEFTRIYVRDGKAFCGDRLDNRVGPATIREVHFSSCSGLYVETSRGTVWSPPADCQATWIP